MSTGTSFKTFGHLGGEQTSQAAAGTARSSHEGAFPRGASAHAAQHDSPGRAGESKSMNLTDFQPQPVWVVGPDGCADYFNLYWERFTGLCEEESLHFGWIRALHPDDVDAFLKRLRSSVDRPLEFEVRLKGVDGRYHRHLCRPSLLPGSERVTKLLISCVDVEDWRSSHDTALEQAALLGSSLRAYDEEKRKNAHAIHDSAGQYLIALQMKLDGLQRGSGNGSRKNPFVDECRELVKRCSRELRSISYLLHPPLLDDLGLEAAIRFHVDSFVERTKIKVELDIEPNLGRLDRDLEIALFRVVQEALANIDRQAAGQSVRIRIGASSSNAFVEATASAGMPGLRGRLPVSPRSASGLSMAIARERIRQIGGTFELTASPGLSIRATVPRRALVSHACD